MNATNINISAKEITITLDENAQSGNTLSCQYVPGTNKVQDISGNLAAAFTQNVDVSVLVAPPTVVSAEVGLIAANIIDINLSATLAATLPDNIDFVADFTGGAVNVTGRQITTTHLKLTLDRNIAYGETGTIAYIPGTNKLQGTSYNYVAAFSQVVTNNMPIPGTKPVLVSATIENANRDKVILTFDQALIESPVPATSAFVIDGKTFTLVSISGAVVALTASVAFAYGDTPSVAYTKPGSNPIMGLVGSLETDNFTNAVTNNITIEAETATLITAGRYTNPPSEALKVLINATILGLKSDGVFALGDALWVWGEHESLFACQDWIENAHNCIIVNNATFTPKVGFTGDGATKSLNLNYTPSTEANHMQLGSESIMFMCPTLGSVDAKTIFGGQKTASPIVVNNITFKTAANELMYISSDGTNNNNINMGAGDYIGYTRTGIVSQGFKAGVPSGAAKNITQSSALLPYVMRALCNGNNATPAAWYNGSLSFLWLGGYLTNTQMLALYTRLKYFNDNVGGTF